MVIYSKETKILIIPAGGSGGSGIIPTSGDCSEAIEQARTEGYNSGKAAQKAADDAKITPTLTVIENGQYTANYGYKKVVVDVPTSGDCSEAIAIAYQSGYTAGQADCPDCPPCPSGDCSEEKAEAYSSGITAGVAEQKAKLVSTAITQNGTYTRENGWNSVQVNVSHQNIYYPIVISGTFVTQQDVTINEPYHWLGYDYLDNIEAQSPRGGANHYIFIDGISAIDIDSARVVGSPITFTAGTHTYKMECNGAWIANAPYETYNSLSNFQFGNLLPSGISNVNIKLFINKEQ